MKVEFYKHNLGVEEQQKVLECLSGIFLTTGQYVKDFENRFAQYLGLKNVVGLTSCTAALHLSLLALDIGPGDEVITTPMTFIATANAILYVGAKPVFVDVEPQTGLIDPLLIEAAITSRTKAIIPVHLYGQMCDMKAISKIAHKYNLKLIEDCAHCVEGVRDGVRPGQLSDAACYSFYATKNLTCGEGGAVACNDDSLAQRLMTLRQHGMSKSAADRYTGAYQHWDMTELGWKYNMSNIQAALLIPQIDRIEERWQKRDLLYKLYRHHINKISYLNAPKIVDGVKSAYHLFTIKVPADQRDALLGRLNSNDIGCAVNYRAVHLLTFYKDEFGYKLNTFPKAEQFGFETISLPFWIGLAESQVEHVARILNA
ncbi:MAG: DegT/DnrJ/EryC1/StrS family aminotransferase [Candidatus Omnitrophica bacterium]|nr:DegT/DnrJ/EryC1/StrS family aminotransferase [Candidatus Omnitrophota bacterium]